MAYVFKKAGDSFVLDQKSEIENELPSGVYKVEQIPQVGIVFKNLKIQKDNLIRVGDSETDKIVSFINNFTTEQAKARYKQVKVIHKTGILLYGEPGTGKSGTINLVIDELISKDAIILFDAEPALVAAVLPALRQQNPEKLICIVYEEFDEWLKSDQSTINSFLDGQLSVNNMIVLATTNYISKIPARIKNRPSRFQYVKEIGVPSVEFRREWFKLKLADIGHSDKLELFMENSEGMVVDQMKDMLVSHLALDIPMHDVIAKLKEMSENAVGLDDYIEDNYFQELKKSELAKTMMLPVGLKVIKLLTPKKDE